jgi:hypothetical protein
MGGNAIPNARRITTAELLEIVEKLMPILKKYYQFCYVPKFMGNKETHGDVDFMVTLPVVDNHRELLKAELQSKHSVVNGTTGSYEYNGVQIDVSLHSAEDFVTTCWYKNYGDVSMLIGVMTHHVGLVYGMDGLRLRLGFEDGKVVSGFKASVHHFHEITLSKSPKAIFQFLGLSYEKYSQGFYDQNEIVDFLAKSPYFFAPHFYPHDESACHRYREKRPSYQEVRRLIKERADLPQTHLPTNEEMIDIAVKHFQCQKKVEDFVNLAVIHDKVKQRFNGDTVGQVSGLTQKALGNLMQHLRKVFTQLEIACMTDEEWKTRLDKAIEAYRSLLH